MDDCPVCIVPDKRVTISLMHCFQLSDHCLARFLQFGNSQHGVATNQRIGIPQRLREAVGHCGIGIADVAQFENGLTTYLWLGVVQVGKPRLYLAAAGEILARAPRLCIPILATSTMSAVVLVPA